VQHRKREKKDTTTRKKNRMKRCNKCNKLKSLQEFHKHSTAKDGLRYECKNCRKERDRIYRRTPAGRAASKRSNKKQVEKGNAAKATLKYNLKKFNLTLVDYDLLSAEQDHVCAICNNINENGRRLSVDHDHETGKVRSLLCMKCNSLLGFVKDDVKILKNAINYLKRYET